MNIFLIILFVLTLVMASLIILGINVSERAFKIIVLLLLLLIIANDLGWFHALTGK